MSYALEIAPKSWTMIMQHKGFKAQLMQAPRLKDTGRAHGLPPGHPIPVYHIDALPGCPDEWVRGPGTYICPVDNNALWFDWTGNDHMNTAVIASVKGMNPITGRKLEGLALEKYAEKCPVHDIVFAGDGRLCKECGFKWPPQSYVSYPNVLWWDGFRQADGTVRQFFFTEDEERDVASLVIGKKNTVPAFGFVFYEPKIRRQAKLIRSRGGPGGSSVMSFGNSNWTQSKGICGQSAGGHHGAPALLDHQVNINHNESDMSVKYQKDDSHQVYCSNALMSAAPASVEEKTANLSILRSASLRSTGKVTLDSFQPEADKDVSVGAGAIIAQDLCEDNVPISDWKTEPSGVIRLYFVFRKKFEKIVNKGLVDLDGDKDGYLKGLPVG